MFVQGKISAATLAALIIGASLSGCNSGSRKDYNYYKNNPDEAMAFAGQCSLNGTMGMIAEQIAQCNAARNARAAQKRQS